MGRESVSSIRLLFLNLDPLHITVCTPKEGCFFRFPLPVFTLSLPNFVISPLCFLTAYKMTSSPSIVRSLSVRFKKPRTILLPFESGTTNVTNPTGTESEYLVLKFGVRSEFGLRLTAKCFIIVTIFPFLRVFRPSGETAKLL